MANIFSKPRSKLAFDPMSGSGDTNFEQSFSNLAHAYLKDSAPSLLDHELGFQLLDKNEDESRAVGIFAFMVGAQILYAPVFFLQGDLKGNELLYVKNQDIFVPLKEGWLQYILNRAPSRMGGGVDSNTASLGVRRPDLAPLSQTPGKTASHVADFAEPFMSKYASLQLADFATEMEALRDIFSNKLSFENRLKQATIPEVETICNLVENNSIIAEGFNRWYGFDKLAAAVKQAVDNGPKPSAMDLPDLPQPKDIFVPGNVDVYLDIDMLPSDVSEPELEYFYSHSVLIRDNRKPVEIANVVDESHDIALTGPTATGRYRVLGKTGKTEDMIVLVRPAHRNGFSSRVALLDPSGNRRSAYKPDQLFLVNAEGNPQADFRDWFEGKGDGSPRKGGTYIAVTEDGMSTVPFSVSRAAGRASDGSEAFVIDFHCYFENADESDMEADTATRKRLTDASRESYLYVGAKRDSKIHSSNDDIYVPATAKFISVDAHSRDEDKFVPGDIHDAQRRMLRGTVKVKATRDEKRYAIDGQKMASKQAALKALVLKYRLSADAGTAVLEKLASKSPCASYAFHVKLAGPMLTEGAQHGFGMDFTEPQNGPNFMGYEGNIAPSGERAQVVDDMSASKSDLSGYQILEDGRNAINNYVQQASQRGDKDVFDIGMLGAMLKTVKDDLIVDDHIPELMKAMDRLGRLIFLFYWHYDKFSARFGKQDMPELEDALRNSFEMLSDVILFLKNKTIEPYDEDDQAGVSLNDPTSN